MRAVGDALIIATEVKNTVFIGLPHWFSSVIRDHRIIRSTRRQQAR